MKRIRGFTLIEILVVVGIVALLSAISVIAVNQSADRRYPAEAEKLSIWLDQISQLSLLEGAAYGLLSEADEQTGTISVLKPVIYYRKRWLQVSSPEPFFVAHNGNLQWNLESIDQDEFMPQSRSPIVSEESYLQEEEEFDVPDLVFLPDGYSQPEGSLRLLFENYTTAFVFRWDDEEGRIIMQTEGQ